MGGIVILTLFAVFAVGFMCGLASFLIELAVIKKVKQL